MRSKRIGLQLTRIIPSPFPWSFWYPYFRQVLWISVRLPAPYDIRPPIAGITVSAISIRACGYRKVGKRHVQIQRALSPVQSPTTILPDSYYLGFNYHSQHRSIENGERLHIMNNSHLRNDAFIVVNYLYTAPQPSYPFVTVRTKIPILGLVTRKIEFEER